MRIILAAHAPWRPTAYGIMVEPLVEMWRGLGHEAMVLAIDCDGGPLFMDWHGIRVALPNQHRFGQDVIADLVRSFRADVVVSNFDPWVLSEPGFGRALSGAAWVGWFPVDQEPLPYHLPKLIPAMDVALTESEWGLGILRRLGLGLRAQAMPVPVDVEGFDLVDELARKRARAALGIDPGAQVIGLIGTNLYGDRKALAEQIGGFCLYAKEYPEALLLLHTEPQGAVNVPALLNSYGFLERVVSLQGFARDYGMSEHRKMALLYQAMDVLLHATAAEGFGLCMLEAMACGIPVIYAENTSMPELVDGYGVPVMWDRLVKTWSVHGGWWNRPTAEGVADALEYYFERGGKENVPGPQMLRERALEFSPERLAERWKAVFEKVEAVQ